MAVLASDTIGGYKTETPVEALIIRILSKRIEFNFRPRAAREFSGLLRWSTPPPPAAGRERCK